MIFLKELLKNRELNEIKFLTSSDIPDKEVREITVMEVPEVEKWLMGKELVLTSFFAVKNNVDAQIKLVETLGKKNVSGLLIKLGPHVKKLSPAVIKKAEEVNLHILQVPPEMPYVEILGSVMRKIVEAEQETRIIENFFSKLILENVIDTYEINEIKNYFGIKAVKELFYMILVSEKNLDLEDLTLSNFYKGQYGEYHIIYFLNKDRSIIEAKREKLIKYLETKEEKNFILGDIEEGISTFNDRYRELRDLFLQYENLKNGEEFFTKRDIEEKLCEIKYINTSGKRYYNKYLKNLVSEDLKTLEALIENDLNIKETSKTLYLHKNTVRYRLTQIENKTGLDLHSLKEILKIYFGLQYIRSKNKRSI